MTRSGVHWHPICSACDRAPWDLEILPGKVSCQWAEIRDFQRWNQAILAISTAKHPVHLDKIPIVSFISSINKWFQGSILSIIYFYEFIASRLITIFQNDHLRLAPPSFAGHTWRLRPQAAVFVDHRVLTCAIRKEIVYIRYMSSLYTYTYIYIYIYYNSLSLSWICLRKHQKELINVP